MDVYVTTAAVGVITVGCVVVYYFSRSKNPYRGLGAVRKNKLLSKFAGEGSPTQLRLLLSVPKGINVNRRYFRGPALCSATRFGHFECVKILVDFGADIDMPDMRGDTPLICAARGGRADIAAYIIKKTGPQKVHEKGWKGLTALHWGALNGRDEVCTLLLKHGAQVNSLTNALETPLHFASGSGHVHVIEILLKQPGVLLNEQDKNGLTPLHWSARRYGNLGLSLIEAGADVSIESNEGLTAFQVACLRGNTEHVTAVKDKEKADYIKTIVSMIPGNETHEIEQLRRVLEHLCTNDNEDCNKTLKLLASNIATLGCTLLKTKEGDESSAFKRLVHTFVNVILTVRSKTETAPCIEKSMTIISDLWDALETKLDTTEKALSEEPNDEAKSVMLDTAFIHARYIIEAYSSITKVSSGEDKRRFLNFVKDRASLFQALISDDVLLLTGPFEFVLQTLDGGVLPDSIVKLLDLLTFDQKRSWLLRKVHEDASEGKYEGVNILVNRSGGILQNSCGSIMSNDARNLKGKLWVKFEGEEGVGRGVLREWFSLLSQEMFDPNNALFKLCQDGVTFQFNPQSHVNADHLSYFRFIGRVIGMAIYHGEYLSVHFTRSVYKHMLGRRVLLEDLEVVDTTYYTNLSGMRKYNIDDADLGLTFSIQDNTFDKPTSVPLKKNGEEIDVTEKNKEEYMQLVTEYLLFKGVEKQLEAFLSGFYDVIPMYYVRLFNEYELELLISGLPSIDIEDWKKNSKYVDCKEDSEVVQWFWKYVHSSNKREQASLLQFVTGSACVPLGGFKCLSGPSGTSKFTIKCTGSPESLPSASTCFNLVRIPNYTDEKILVEKFNMAIGLGKSFAFN